MAEPIETPALDALAGGSMATPALDSLVESLTSQAAAREPWRMHFDTSQEYHDYFQKIPEHQRNETHGLLFGAPYYPMGVPPAPTQPLSWAQARREIPRQVGYEASITGTVARLAYGVPTYEPMRVGRGAVLTPGQEWARAGVGAVHGLAEMAPLMAAGLPPTATFATLGAVGARAERPEEYGPAMARQAAIGAAMGVFYRIAGKLPGRGLAARLPKYAAMGFAANYAPARLMGVPHEVAARDAIKSAVLFPLMHETLRGIHGAKQRARIEAWMRKAELMQHGEGVFPYRVIAADLFGADADTVNKARAAWATALKGHPEIARYVTFEVGPVKGGAAETGLEPIGDQGNRARIVVRFDPRVAKAAPRDRLIELAGHEAKHAGDILTKKFRAPGGVRAWFQERAARRYGKQFASFMNLNMTQGEWNRLVAERAAVPPSREPVLTGLRTLKPQYPGGRERALGLEPQWRGPAVLRLEGEGPAPSGVRLGVPAATAAGPRAVPGLARLAATPIDAIRRPLARLLRTGVPPARTSTNWQQDPLLTKRVPKGTSTANRRLVSTLRQQLRQLYTTHPDVTLGVKGTPTVYQPAPGRESIITKLIGPSAQAPLTAAERKMLAAGPAAPLAGELKKGAGGLAGLVARAVGPFRAVPGKLRQQGEQILYRYSGTVDSAKAAARTTVQNMVRQANIPRTEQYRVLRDIPYYIEAKFLGAKRGSPYVPGQSAQALIQWFESKGYHNLALKMNAYKETFRRQYNADPNTRNVAEREAHVARHWRAEQGRLRDYAGRLRQDPKAKQMRYYETRWDAIDSGLKPKYDSYIEDVVAHAEDFATAGAARQAVSDIRALVKANPGILTLPEKAPPGWKTTKWRSLTSQVRRPIRAFDPKTGEFKLGKQAVGEVGVHPDLYGPLQYLLSTDPVPFRRGLGVLARMNATARTLRTTLSPFHYGALFENYISSAGAKNLGTVWSRWRTISKNLQNPQYVAKWAGHGLNLSNARPTDVVQRTDNLLRRWGQQLEMRGAVRGGGIQYQVGRAMRVAGQWSPFQGLGSLLFEYWKPHLMADNAEVLRGYFMSKGMDEGTAMRMAARKIRVVYGQMQPNWEPNFWANPKVRAWGHALLFSYSWTTGALRQAGDIVPSEFLGPLGKGYAAGSPGSLGGPYHLSSITFWLRFAAAYAAVHQLTNLYFTWRDKGEARWTWENPPGKRLDFYYGKRPDGKDGYMHFGKQGRELFRYVANPLQAVYNKMSVPARVLLGQAWGQQPSGIPLTGTARGWPLQAAGTGEPWGGETTLGAQLPHRAAYALEEFAVPFPVGSWQRGAAGIPGFLGPTGVGMTTGRAAPALAGIYKRVLETGDQRHMQAAEVWVNALRENGIDPSLALAQAKAEVMRGVYRNFWRAVKAKRQPSQRTLRMMKQAGVTNERLVSSAERRVAAGSLKQEEANRGLRLF